MQYPYLMNKLYEGSLEWEDVKFARIELTSVKKRLASIHPSQVVWDIDDLSQRPPWEDSLCVTTKKGIAVKIVFVRNRNKKSEYLYLLSTDCGLPDAEIVRIYGNRWSIECFF